MGILIPSKNENSNYSNNSSIIVIVGINPPINLYMDSRASYSYHGLLTENGLGIQIHGHKAGGVNELLDP